MHFVFTTTYLFFILLYFKEKIPKMIRRDCMSFYSKFHVNEPMMRHHINVWLYLEEKQILQQS